MLQKLTLISSLFFASTVLANPSQNFVTFGDSLADNGYKDGHGFNRYSNGRVWPEYVSEKLNLHLDDRAWGGAQSGEGNINGLQWSGLLWQVKQYLAKDKPNQHTVYSIGAGLNDLLLGQDQSKAVVQNLDSAIQLLAKQGAGKIIVFNLPDVTQAPAYEKNPMFKNAKNLVEANLNKTNVAFKNQETLWQKTYPNTQFCFVDLSHFLKKEVGSKQFENTKDAWQGTYINPAEHAYLWWDEWHPMTAAHEILADHVMNTCETMLKG